MKTFRTLLVELKQLPAEMGYILGWAGDILAALIFVGTVILYVGASNEPLLALGGFIVALVVFLIGRTLHYILTVRT